MQKWVADLPDYVPESAARLLQALLDKTIVEGLNFVKRNQKYQKVRLGTEISFSRNWKGTRHIQKRTKYRKSEIYSTLLYSRNRCGY